MPGKVPGRAREAGPGGAWEGSGGWSGGAWEVPGRLVRGVWEVPGRLVQGCLGGCWRGAREVAGERRGGCTGPPLHWWLVGIYTTLGTPACMLASPATGDMPENRVSR